MTSAPQIVAPKSSPPSLKRFAFLIAGPREFVIAGTINGLIATWLFGFTGQVSLIGSGSVMSMWIPLSLLLPGLSSFFGVLAGALSRKGGVVSPPLASEVPWLAFACRCGLIRGGLSLMIHIAILSILKSYQVELTLSAAQVVFGITIASGMFAYAMHSTAILRTRILGASSVASTDIGNS